MNAVVTSKKKSIRGSLPSIYAVSESIDEDNIIFPTIPSELANDRNLLEIQQNVSLFIKKMEELNVLKDAVVQKMSAYSAHSFDAKRHLQMLLQYVHYNHKRLLEVSELDVIEVTESISTKPLLVDQARLSYMNYQMEFSEKLDFNQLVWRKREKRKSDGDQVRKAEKLRRNSDSGKREVVISFPPPNKKPRFNSDGIPSFDVNPITSSTKHLSGFTVSRNEDRLSLYLDKNFDLSECSLRGFITSLVTDPDCFDTRDIALFTSQYFISPEIFLNYLVMFYRVPQESKETRKNVVNFIQDWISLYYSSLSTNKKWNDIMKRFLSYVKNKSKTDSDNLNKAIMDYKYYNLISSTLISEKKKEQPPSISLLDIDSELMAEQMCLAEQQLFLRISMNEFCFTRWMGSFGHLPRQAPNLMKYINRSNEMTYWIASTVVDISLSLVDRGAVIAFWIEVMDECIENNNLTTSTQIFNALSMPPIERLKKSWSYVPKSAIEVWEKAEPIFSPESNYSKYRAILKTISDSDPCIPKLEVHLRDFTFIEEMSNKGEEGHINFQKFQTITNALKSLYDMQSERYPFIEHPDVQQFLFHIKPSTEDEIYALSAEVKKLEKMKLKDITTSQQSRKGRITSEGRLVPASSVPSRKPKSKRGNKSRKVERVSTTPRAMNFKDLEERTNDFVGFQEYLEERDCEKYLEFFFMVKNMQNASLEGDDLSFICLKILNDYLGFGDEDCHIAHTPTQKNFLKNLVEKSRWKSTMFAGIKEEVGEILSTHYGVYVNQ